MFRCCTPTSTSIVSRRAAHCVSREQAATAGAWSGTRSRLPGPSHALMRFESPGANGSAECFIVAFVLFGVAFGEVGDRLIEAVVLAEVGGDGDRVSGSSVGSRECVPAQACVGGESGRHHGLDDW